MKLRYEESYVKLRVKQHVIFTVYDCILHLTLLLTPVKYDTPLQNESKQKNKGCNMLENEKVNL